MKEALSCHSPSVLFEEIACAGGKKIAIATLNAPQSLNALSLPMVDLLYPQFLAWQDDDDVVAVFFHSAGEKAFCAGGDIKAMRQGCAAYGEELSNDLCAQFFEREYRLDYLLHTYAKPIIVWGNGVVMGGGKGLMCGASHRVVTETSMLAMPEISIGLYPDVGGTWFLNRIPEQLARFIGITGARLNATDAKFLGWADRFIPHFEKAAVLADLKNVPWSEDAAEHCGQITHLLRRFEQRHESGRPEANLQPHLDWINLAADGDDLLQVIEQISTYQGDDPWCSHAAKTLAAGCPITPFLVQEQLLRGRHLSLKEIFQLEWVMSVNCARLGHTSEGIRALLVDKDRQPKWLPSSFSEVSKAHIDAHFEAPFSAAPLAGRDNPLLDL